MKKGLHIALFLLGLIFVSCEKQEIVPNTGTVQDIPSWDSSGNRGSIPGEGDIIDGDDDGNDIVDPNNPDDGVKKKP